MRRGSAGRLALRPAIVLLAGLCLVAGSARAEVPEAVEDLLFDLQLVPLDGPAAPALDLSDLDGHRTSLAAARGQVVLLYFWATW
jgi:cytochrome oxidase Cu insertion factor (SCO1/SenC/PrrC family)